MKNIFVLVTLFLSLMSESIVRADASHSNVILLMLDGVRWQEVFHGSDPSIDARVNEGNLFKNLFSTLGEAAFLSGDRRSGSENTVSNRVNISLPAYESIMVGKTTPCRTNNCDRVDTETLQERIVRELSLKKTDVATIASWPKIALAVEHVKGQTFVNAGSQPILEGVIDPVTHDLNKKQKENSPFGDARQDAYTFAQSLSYIKNNQPRFLFISLNDSDELAHMGDYPQYISTLKGYDAKIKSLFALLESMGEYGNSTSVIITTDHGRGNSRSWGEHGVDDPDSKYIWIYGKNPKLAKSKSKFESTGGYTHLDIRPTVEALLGLTPTHCDKCGKVIRELSPES